MTITSMTIRNKRHPALEINSLVARPVLTINSTGLRFDLCCICMVSDGSIDQFSVTWLCD